MLAALLVVVVATLSCPSPAARAAAASTRKQDVEIQKLEAERDKARGDNAFLVRVAPLLTALVAAAALYFTARKGINELKEQRAERQRAETEANAKRFDERFTAAVAGAAADAAEQRRASAVLLDSLVRERGTAQSEQALNLLLALMQSEEQDDVTARLRSRALERVIKQRGRGAAGLELTHLRAARINLEGADLSGADIAFAHLQGARLRSADLQSARGVTFVLSDADLRGARLSHVAWSDGQLDGVRFNKAHLTGARLHRCDLRRADFYEADLSGADLRAARLEGSKFHAATLTGAVFSGAKFDEAALETIAATASWREARFSKAIQARLSELADAKVDPQPKNRTPGAQSATAEGDATGPASLDGVREQG